VAPGNHTVVYTDANGCSGSSFLGVTVGTVVTGTAASTPTFCATTADGTVTVTTNNGTNPFTYSLDNGTAQSSNVFNTVTAGLHNITFTDANGCIGTTTVTVTSGTGLSATAVADSTSCPTASNGTITITPSNGSGPYTYSLDGGTAQSNSIFNGVPPGNHNVIVTDANGCIGGVASVVPAGSSISATAGFTDASCSVATNGTVTGVSATGTAPYTYSLDGGTAQASATFTGVAPGNHYVTFTDVDGCVASDTVTVGFGPDLTGSASSTPTACPGVSDGTVTVNPAGGITPFTYSIDGGPSQGSNLFTGIAAGNHNVSFTDAAGCPGTTTVSVAPGTSISSNIIPGNPPCALINDGTITINPTSGTGPYEYALNGGPWQGSNVFQNLAPGNYNIDIRNISGCLGTNVATLSTNSLLTTTLTSAMPLCNGNSNGSISMSPAGGVSPYQYSIDGGTTYQSNPLISGLPTGTYTVRIQDNAGCIKDTTLFIDEPALLTAAAVSSPASCGGNDGSITVSAAGGTPGYSYSVNNGASFQSGTSFTVADGNYPNILVRDNNQCIASASVIVDRIDNMFLDIVPDDTTVCQESSVTIIPQTNTQTNIFAWSALNAPQSTIANPSAQNAVITPTDTATYVLHATWGVCERWDTILIHMLHKPIADAGPDTAICFDRQEAYIHGTASNLSGTVNYSWTPTAGVASPNDQNTDVLINNTTIFTLTVTDNYGCNFSVTDQVVVAKQPPVPAFAGNDTITPTGIPIRLLASGGASYLWTPAGVLDDPTSNSPIATIVNDTRFAVMVTDIAGCKGTDTVFVKVYDGPTYYVPNAFSPNGDGLNDVFRPIPVGIVTTDFFRIFNRYGDLIFDTNKWLMGWDGSYKGRQQPIGNYIWVIKGRDINGKVIERKGNVILIR
jgi:gliding motility-associated-like protein